jgi:ATP/maltotriose-dependent transcriptional regulator MalT
VAYRRGSIPDAESRGREAYDASRLPGATPEARHGMWFKAAALIDALVERGEFDAAEAIIDESGMDCPLPEIMHLNVVLATRASLRLAEGRVQEALDDVLECGRRLEAWGSRNPAMVHWRPTGAAALAALGDRDEARRLIDTDIELARAFEVPRELGISLRVAALVGPDEERIDRLSEAVSVLEPSGAPLELARAQTDLGAALRRRGDRTRAREPLRTALDLAQRCGGTALADRAHTELLATGARPRRLVLTGIEALTASERRVAEMATDGLGNREIAQALFVSEKTIERHLSNAYRKLDISARSELPRALGLR